MGLPTRTGEREDELPTAYPAARHEPRGWGVGGGGGNRAGGIPEELHTRIFELFCAPQVVGASAKLGVDISYRIITGHNGGDMWVVSEPRRLHCRVRLPLATSRGREGVP